MKRYIRSTIENLYTLQEWAEHFDGKPNTYIYIYATAYEWWGEFAKLKLLLAHPEQYDDHVYLVSDYYVVDVEHTKSKDHYSLYLESPN